MKSTMLQDPALLSRPIENERARMINVAKIDIFAEQKARKTAMPGHSFNYHSSIVLYSRSIETLVNGIFKSDY